MRKKSVVALLSLLSALGFTLGASACDFKLPFIGGDSGSEQSSVNGFEVKASLEVSAGAVVELEQPVVTDAKGVLLDCWTYVTDENGNYVATSAGSFVAENVGVYTITYVVRDSDNNTYQKQTTVNVSGDNVSGDLTLKVNYEQFVTVGETIDIDAICSDENAALSYVVKRFTTGQELSVEGNSFVPFEAGIYEILVSAANGAATYKYNIFAEEEAKTGEVESFGSAWEEREQFVGGKRQDWEVVSSEEAGILDPYGVARNFAKYSTDRAYIPLFIDIRQDVEYYEQLADEGYTHVSMWIYMESSVPHITISDRDANGGFYRREGPDLYPGQWTEFRLSLLDTNNSWTRSFTTCYDLYANQNHFYFQVDNSYEYNTWGGGDNITFYFTDIYAVKDVKVGLAEGVTTAKSVKDTVNLGEGFDSTFDLTYAMEYRGDAISVTGNEYTFTSNGTFNVSAIPTDFSLRGCSTVSYQVTDGQELSSTYVAKELVGTSVEMNVSELNAAFATVNGVTPTLESYTVYNKNGEVVPMTDGAVALGSVGTYTVEIKGTYAEDGVDYTTYHTLPFDVWSAETKYSVIDVEEMRCIRAWDWDNSQTTATYVEETVGGKTGNFIKTTAKGQSLTFYAKTLYSKSYYEAMLAQYADMKVRINVYFTPAATEKTTNFRSFYKPSKVEWFDKYNDQWQLYEVSLADFIELYDEINGKYEQYKSASWGADTDGYQGTWLQLIGSHVGRTAYMSVKLGTEATEATVALKDGASFAVNAENDLNSLLDVTLNGATGRITGAEVYFNNEWVALENCKFNPSWEVSYQFRLNVQSIDGLAYKTVEKTFVVGDGSFEATTDDEFYSAKVGDRFDVSSILTDDYQYSVKLLRSINGTETEVGEYPDGIIVTEGLSAGSYTVNVYANDGNGAFSQILYYSLTLDVWSEDMKYAVLDTDNMKVVRAWDWGSTSFKVNYQEYTVGGRTGDYVRAVSNSGSQSLIIYAKPLYSKAYYEALYAENAALTVLMDTYHIAGKANGKTSFWSVFSPTLVDYTDTEHNNRWLTYSMALEEFISKYDSIEAKYEEKKFATDGDGDSGAYTSAWIYITGGALSHEIYVNASISVEATEATAVMKEDSFFTVDSDNDLNELLNVTVDGAKGYVAWAEIYFNNEWVTLENCKFNPAWEITYDFRLNVKSEDGLKYKEVTVSLSVGDGNFSSIKDTALYAVKAGETFNFSNLTTADYNFEIVLFRSVNGKMTEQSRIADGTVIETAGLKAGSYEIKVYASKGNNSFSNILYYELILDVWTEEMKYAVLDTSNMRTIRAWDWDNSQTTVEYGEYTVGGVTGDFIKATAKGQSLVTYARPLYSKAYYQAILESNEQAKLNISIYFTPAVTGGDNNFRSIYNPSKSEWFDKYNDQWQSYEMKLSDFLSVYDEVVSKYEQYANASYGAGTDGYQGSWIQLIGSWIGRTVYFNVTMNA